MSLGLSLTTALLLSSAGASSQARARALIQQGLQLYELGRYDQAIDLFEQAHDIAPAAGITFNIAQTYWIKGRGSCGRAQEAYQRFLHEAPQEHPHRSLAEERLEAVHGCAVEEARQHQPTGAPADPVLPPGGEPARTAVSAAGALPARPASGWLPLGLSIAGAGAAVAGGGLMWSASREYDGLAAGCGRTGTCVPTVWAPLQRREQVGVALVAAGSLVLAGAGVLARSRFRTPRVNLVVGAGPGFAGWAVGGRW